MAENKLYNFNLPSPYQAELSRIADQRRMAEMLQVQSQSPTERFSYKGIEAHTPATAGLAKLLQGFGGAYFQREALDQEKALGERYRSDQLADMTTLGTAINAPAVPGRVGQAEVPAREAEIAPEEMVQSADYGTPLPGAAIPAVPAIAARQAGYIGPEMIAGMKTPEGANQVLALSLAQRQSQIEAERRANEPFNLTGEQTRFQPVPGGPPIPIASGVPKTPFAPIDVSKFTPASVQAAMNPDGTVDRTKLVPITEPRTGQLGVYDEYAKQERDAGRVPKSIEKYETDQKRAGRTPAAQRERSVYDADRGGVVNLETGAFTPATQSGKPLSPKNKPLTESQAKAAVFESQMRGATDELALIPGYNPESGFSQAETAVAGGRGNMMVSENAQRAKQAQSQWAESFLRFKTGAASNPAEIALNIATFFPQFGDKPGNIAQKKRMRARAESDIAFASGNALSQKQNKPSDQTKVPDPLDPLGLRR
ncbi:hypothetical protein UFOVP1469_49 [uncultured Caudovirales phage]|uniref:Uncharacterized protein n=1 Tax=uncultured Caudovirales phage TaxID=2100421 RepID=A0A6J5SKW5_9CAUD|nr:hypothetical protein UFOVP1469_49 [uncultured Caudovirales phage]CAB5229182.1 hypothetical protein UFOVP1556_3 [uncultured Caudovirales phage]